MERQPPPSKFHFGSGHFCAGCDLETVLHPGCPPLNSPPPVSEKKEAPPPTKATK